MPPGTCACEVCEPYGGCEFDAELDSDLCWDCTEGAHV